MRVNQSNITDLAGNSLAGQSDSINFKVITKNLLPGTSGNDTLKATDDPDVAQGGAGSDTMSYVSSPQGVLFSLTTEKGSGGWAQGDQCSGMENVTGSRFNDNLTGAAGGNKLDGGAGNDTMNGMAGVDNMVGGAGNDRMLGGIGNDKMQGGVGNDRMQGGAGNDNLVGNAGKDNLFGDAGNDIISGAQLFKLNAPPGAAAPAEGNLLNGGTGNDTLLMAPGDTGTGGAGKDTFGVTLNQNPDVGPTKVTDYQAGEKISIPVDIGAFQEVAASLSERAFLALVARAEKNTVMMQPTLVFTRVAVNTDNDPHPEVYLQVSGPGHSALDGPNFLGL